MNLPTKITVIRIALIPAFIAAFLTAALPYNKFIAAGIFLLAALTDFLDGYIARKYNLITDLGKFLDPIADKLLVAAALFLLVYDKIEKLEPYLTVCCIAVIFRELAISALRIVAASKGVVLAADKLGKVKTTLQLAAIPFLTCFNGRETVFNTAADAALTYTGFALMAAAAAFTLISGVNYIVRNAGVFKEDSR